MNTTSQRKRLHKPTYRQASDSTSALGFSFQEGVTMKIRCSELPRALKCPASLGAGVRIDEEGEAARIGSAVHECLAKTIKGEDCDWESIARAWNVEPDQVTPLAGAGMKAWNEMDITPVAVEEHLTAEVADGITLTGHADIIGDTVSAARVVLDWKTGGSSSSYRDQLIGYAMLARENGLAEQADYTPVAVVWLRDGVLDTEYITADEIGELRSDLKAISAKTDRYSAGEHCLYCPRRHDCDAREANLRADVKVLTEAKCEALTTPELAALKPKADALKKVIASYGDLLKRRLAESGPVDLGDGREVVLEKGERRYVKTLEALPVLEEYGLTVEDIADAVTISKSKVGNLLAASAERGQKGAVRTDFDAALEAAGALEVKEMESVKIRRSQKSLTAGG